MKEKKLLTPEALDSIMADIQEKYPAQYNYTMSQDIRDYIGASLKLPGYHNNSMRRRILRNAEKNHNRRVVEGRRNKAGLHHYITGKDN